MVQAFRIVKEKWAGEALSGEGARLAGGRFNSVGSAVVYASASLALAELEILVNLPTDRLLGSYVAFEIRFPEEAVDVLDADDLPGDWRRDPAPRDTKVFGDAWTRSKRSLALRVPSAVVPSEHNYLLDPAHPDAEKIDVQGPFGPEIDPRLKDQ